MSAIRSTKSKVALRIIASDSVNVSAAVEVSVSSGDSVDLNYSGFIYLTCTCGMTVCTGRIDSTPRGSQQRITGSSDASRLSRSLRDCSR